MGADTAVSVQCDADIVEARQLARRVALETGFTGSTPTLIATAVSELARNILQYAGSGQIVIGVVRRGPRLGVSVCARDAGPGIASIELAMRDGYSTGGSLGIGLPGARRLLDEFEIQSELGCGTTVRGTKWLPLT